MLHGMRRPAESPHVRVSKDTVIEKNDLGELGKGLFIPAQPLELKLNMHGPAPRPIHAHAMKKKSRARKTCHALGCRSRRIDGAHAHADGWDGCVPVCSIGGAKA